MTKCSVDRLGWSMHSGASGVACLERVYGRAAPDAPERLYDQGATPDMTKQQELHDFQLLGRNLLQARPIEAQVRLNDFRRGATEPLIERDILQDLRGEHLQEDHAGGADVGNDFFTAYLIGFGPPSLARVLPGSFYLHTLRLPPKSYTATGSRAGGAMNSGPTGFLIVSRRIRSTSA